MCDTRVGLCPRIVGVSDELWDCHLEELSRGALHELLCRLCQEIDRGVDAKVSR